MNKFSPRNLLVAAALFAIATESAWSEEATSSAPAAPAEQTAPSPAGAAQGYAPTPYPRGYERYWQPPPWPAPPPGYYGHSRPYYPPHRQYRPAPVAPAANPLSVKLKQTQEQLVAKSTELNTANEQLAVKANELNKANEQLSTLQAEQQATRAALQQAQSETALASEQLSVVIEEMDILNNVLTELKARLDEQNTSLLGILQADAAENDKVDSAVASDVEQVPSPATTPTEPGNTGSEQTGGRDSEPTKPEAE